MFPVQENWAFAFYETTFQPWREARIHCWASIDLPSHPLHITSSPNCKAHSGLYASLIGPREITLSWNDKFWLEDFCVPNSLHDHPFIIFYIFFLVSVMDSNNYSNNLITTKQLLHRWCKWGSSFLTWQVVCVLSCIGIGWSCRATVRLD